jgi:hypothetical protein
MVVAHQHRLRVLHNSRLLAEKQGVWRRQRQAGVGRLRERFLIDSLDDRG